MDRRRFDCGPLWVSVLGLLACRSLLAAEASRDVLIIAAGTRWATPCYVHNTGAAGPTVMLVAGLHGDEPAGAWAAREIRHWPIRRGRLLLLPQANVAALRANAHRTPGVEPARGNLNRQFAQPAETVASDDSPAAAIWQLVAVAQPTWLVDLHEGQDFRGVEPTSIGSSIGTDGTPATRAAANAMLAAVNATIGEKEKRFVLGGRPMVGSLARSASERLRTRTLVLGTTSQDQPLALRIRQHRLMVHALLRHLGLLDDQVSGDSITESPAAGDAIRLAVYAGPGTRRGMHHLLKELEGSPDVTVLPIGPEEIAGGVLEHCNVVLFPGGSSTRQGEALGAAGRQRLRAFVQNGGGYVGICAGAYLATTEFPWSLRILDARTYSSDWKRGRGVVQMELTATGRKIFRGNPVRCDVRYHNGPILVPAGREDVPNYQALAVFRSEVAECGAPTGVMIGAPAIVAGRFGEGRVLCYSPHPDQTKGLEEFVRRGVRWVAGNSPSNRLTGAEPHSGQRGGA